MRLRLLFVWLMLSSAGAQAGTIRIESRMDASVTGQDLKVNVVITNRGDEAAHHVQIESEFETSSKRSPLHPQLPVQESMSAQFHHEVPVGKLGRYPLISRILYTDLNGYPFSVLMVSSQDIATSSKQSEIVGILQPLSLHTLGPLTLTLTNRDNRGKHLQVRLILSKELSADPAFFNLDLDPGETKPYSLMLRNLSALVGSTYPIYAVTEYDQDGIHNTAVASGSVTIVPETAATPSLTRSLYFGTLALLILIVIVYNVRTIKRGK